VSAATTAKPKAVREARRQGEKAAHSRGFEWLARSGFLARGVIYVIVGILAIKLAFGDDTRPTNQQGAMEAIANQPLGKVLLALVAIGLAGYAVSRLVHAALGHGPEESDTTLERWTALGSAVIYAGLCAIAIEVLLGSGGNGSGQAQETTGGVLGWPGGTWLVGIAGVVVVGAGLFQGYRAVTKDFLEDAKVEQMGGKVRTSLAWIGAFGYAARMVVLVLVGVFLVKAAVEYDPNNAVGIDGALAKLAREPYGPYLLCAVAAGLIAFGVYALADARYRRI
jgi:hypothetical protein